MVGRSILESSLSDIRYMSVVAAPIVGTSSVEKLNDTISMFYSVLSAVAEI